MGLIEHGDEPRQQLRHHLFEIPEVEPERKAFGDETAMTLFILSFGAAVVAGAFGAFITKIQPVK